MNSQIRLVVVLCWIVFFSGCFGFVPTGLEPAKHYIEYWEKSVMTAESRRKDSVRCGAADTDYILGFGQNKIKAAQRPDETDNETDTRLLHDWQRCMINKGYRYTGGCYNNEISRTKPACGAP